MTLIRSSLSLETVDSIVAPIVDSIEKASNNLEKMLELETR